MTTPAPHDSPIPVTTPINYIALGDSTGTGVGARDGGYVVRIFKHIVKQRPGSTLTNLSRSGATTSDVLREQLDRAVSANPNLVTLGIGINDIGHGMTPEEFGKNYEQIVSTVRNKTQATIVITNLPDISSAPRIPGIARSEFQRVIIAFNRKVEEIAWRHRVTMSDVFSITHDELPAHPEYFSSDGFHPSDEGYELWAEKMWPVVAQAIGRDGSGL